MAREKEAGAEARVQLAARVEPREQVDWTKARQKVGHPPAWPEAPTGGLTQPAATSEPSEVRLEARVEPRREKLEEQR